MPIGYYEARNFSTISIPLCANMQDTDIINNPILSGLIEEYNTDIAVGKIGVRIPIESAFVFDNQIINIVYDANIPPSSSTMELLGTFTTMTSSTIALCGEWQPLTYDANMYLKHYKYFMEPSNIYAYSNSTYLAYSGSNADVDVSGGLDFGVLASWPTTDSMLTGVVKLGKFDLRVFYDQVKYPPYIPPFTPGVKYMIDFGGSSIEGAWNGRAVQEYLADANIWLTYTQLSIGVSYGNTIGWEYASSASISRLTYLSMPYNWGTKTGMSTYNLDSQSTTFISTLNSVNYRYGASSWPLLNNIFFGQGYYNGGYNDMYKYDIIANIVTPKVSMNTLNYNCRDCYASYGNFAFKFSTILSSQNGTNMYNALLNTWETKVSRSYSAGNSVNCTTVGNKIYNLQGQQSNNTQHNYNTEYDIFLNKYTERTVVPGNATGFGFANSSTTKVYTSGGYSNVTGYGAVVINYEYDPIGDYWTTKTDMNIAATNGSKSSFNY